MVCLDEQALVKTEVQKKTAHFVDAAKWTLRYQRNNKRSGLKNLRCFPYCSDSHRLRGFCGRKVVTQCANVERAELYSWAEFVREVREGNEDVTKVGTLFSESEVEAKLRTKGDPFKPWYVGEPVGGDAARNGTNVMFEYNKQKKGWNYGWVANKHTCDSKHMLRAYIFKRTKSGDYECVSFVDSSPFTLFCRRRQRRNVVDLPEHLHEQILQEEARRKRKVESQGDESSSKKSNKKKCNVKSKSSRSHNHSGASSCCSTTDSALERVVSEDLLQDIDALEESYETPDGLFGNQELSPEKRDQLLLRVIQAVLIYEDKNDKKDDPVNETEPWDALMDQFELIDDTDLGETFDPLDIDLEPATSKWTTPKEVIMEELAVYLIEEQSFTEAIQQVMRSTAESNMSLKDRERKLLDVFADQIELFLNRYLLSLRDLDTWIFPAPSSGLSLSTVIKSNPKHTKYLRPLKPSVTDPIRLCGTWQRTSRTIKGNEEVRKLHLPVLVSKLHSAQENIFELSLRDGCLNYRTSQKLFSTGEMSFTYDGQVRDCEFSAFLPIPRDIFGALGGRSAEPLKYRAFCEDEGTLIVEFLITKELRIIKRTTVNQERTFMKSVTIAQVRKDGKWVHKFGCQGEATRISEVVADSGESPNIFQQAQQVC